MDFNANLLPIVLAFVAALPGILAFLIQLRKSKVENTSLITDAATDVIKTLREEIDRLKEENKELKTRISELEDCETMLKQCQLDIEELYKIMNHGG